MLQKKGLIHTLAGKIAVAALGVCMAGGMIAAGLALAAAPSFMNESCYYMPDYLKDENNRIIIESVDPFNGWATYYSVTMMTGQIHEEVIYEGQFPEFGYSSVILLNHLHTKYYSFTNT